MNRCTLLLCLSLSISVTSASTSFPGRGKDATEAHSSENELVVETDKVLATLIEGQGDIALSPSGTVLPTVHISFGVGKFNGNASITGVTPSNELKLASRESGGAYDPPVLVLTNTSDAQTICPLVADTYVRYHNSDQNYGTATELIVRSYQNFAFLTFDIVSFSGLLKSAELTLTSIENNLEDNVTVEVYGYGDFNENDLTQSNMDLMGNLLSSGKLNATVVGNQVTIDVTNHIPYAKRSYSPGTSVELTATPRTGWKFAGWFRLGRPDSGNPENITLDSDKTILAKFVPDYRYSLNINTDPAGSGTVTTTPLPYSHASGDTVAFALISPEGGGLNIFSKEETNQNLRPTLILNQGEIDEFICQAAVDLYTRQEEPWFVGQNVRLQIYGHNAWFPQPNTMNKRYSFLEFDISAFSGTVKSAIFKPFSPFGMVASEIKAYAYQPFPELVSWGSQDELGEEIGYGYWQFNPNDAELDITDYVKPGADYAPGTEVTLTASPAAGYQFVFWSGDASGPVNPLTISMDDNKAITAVFSPDEPLIADAGPDQLLCEGQSVQIGGSPTASGGTPPLTINWLPSETIDDATSANPTASPTSTTTYTVTVTDANSSQSSDDVTVTVNPLPTVTFAPVGPFFVFEPSVDIAPFASPSGGAFSGPGISGNNFDPGAAGVGSHSITYLFTDANGCSKSADQDVAVVLPALPHAFILLANRKVKIGGQTSSEGAIHSNGRIDFKKGHPSTHTGDLTAVSDMKIDRDNTIVGNAFSGGKVHLKGNAEVTGTVTEHAPVAVQPLPHLSFSAGGANVTVKKHQSQSLAPGSYGKVKVEKGGTLLLSSGDYFFKELDLKENTRLSIEVGNGPATINTVKHMHFHKDSQVDIDSPFGSASRFVTFNSMKHVHVYKGARVLGSIIAPLGRVKLDKNVSFQGAICAKDIDIDKDGTFRHHDSGTTLPEPTPLATAYAEEDGKDIEVTIVPSDFVLSQNYPNPFNPSTTITFSVPEAGQVTLAIYNLMGQLMRTLYSGSIAAGQHSVAWDGADSNGARVASGVYVYRIETKDFVAHKKLVLTK